MVVLLSKTVGALVLCRTLSRDSVTQSIRIRFSVPTTPAEVIIAGAGAYARKRAAEIEDGDPERYTKHPANWLKEGCWDASGDGGPILDERGDAVTPQHGSNGHDSDPSPGWDDPNYLEKAMGRLFS
jgi:hypothetical protein